MFSIGYSMAGFLAYLSADVEGDEVLYIPYDIEMYDYGNNYNTSNGVYTGSIKLVDLRLRALIVQGQEHFKYSADRHFSCFLACFH